MSLHELLIRLDLAGDQGIQLPGRWRFRSVRNSLLDGWQDGLKCTVIQETQSYMPAVALLTITMVGAGYFGTGTNIFHILNNSSWTNIIISTRTYALCWCEGVLRQ